MKYEPKSNLTEMALNAYQGPQHLLSGQLDRDKKLD